MNYILITGATGYIGSCLCRYFIENGYSHIGAIVRTGSECSRIPLQIKRYIYDGRMKTMKDIVGETKPDVVIHLASRITYYHDEENLDAILDSNIIMGTHLLEAMRLVNVNNLITTGTYWQHFNNEEYNPVNLYAASKQAFLDIVKFYVEAYNFRVINLELFDVYGPDDWRQKFFQTLKKAMRSEDVIDMTYGEQEVDFVHINDVLNAYLKAVDRICTLSPKTSEIFAVRTNQSRKLKEVIAIFEEIISKNLKVNYGQIPYRCREMMSPWTNAGELPGWKAEIDLYEGIRRFLEKN